MKYRVKIVSSVSSTVWWLVSDRRRKKDNAALRARSDPEMSSPHFCFFYNKYNMNCVKFALKTKYSKPEPE